MSEERLQEIKDSVDFQYTLAKAKCIDNALLFADEEKELIEEIERLNNIINELEEWLESESNFWKEQQEKAIKNGWLEFGGKYNTTIIYENVINKLQELKGVDKE